MINKNVTPWKTVISESQVHLIFPHFVLFEVREHNVLLVVTVIEVEKSTDMQYLRKTEVKRPL